MASCSVGSRMSQRLPRSEFLVSSAERRFSQIPDQATPAHKGEDRVADRADWAAARSSDRE